MTESSTPRTDAALADAPGIDGNSRIANFMRDLERELAEQKRVLSDSVSKWIPIGDRIPEPERAVLGYWPKNEYYKGGCETVRYCPSDAPDSCDAWIDGHGEAIDAPTHWMPNPETPK